jgi:cytochrome P450
LTLGTHDFEAMTKETFTSAHETFAELRGRCPVAHSNSYDGFWALLKYDDVVEALKQPDVFVTSVQNVVPKVSTTGRRPPLHLDPPEHTPYRSVLNPFFSDRKLERLREPVHEAIVKLLEPFVRSGGGDICKDFSHKLPGYALASFFNLSTEMSMTIRETTSRYVHALHVGDKPAIQRHSQELYQIARELIDSRKRGSFDPGEDVVAAYLHKTYNGAPLPDELILGTIRQLIVVGMIAPVIFIGSMTVHLAQNPSVHDMLRQDLSLVPDAIEEYLRLFTPYRGFARTPTRDVVIGGRTIRKDEPIAMVFSSANRDESVFPDSDQFILHRPNIKDHIAFGVGPHRCPGAPLARMMLQMTLTELLRRVERIELAGEIEMTNWPEWGAASVPVKITPAGNV